MSFCSYGNFMMSGFWEVNNSEEICLVKFLKSTRQKQFYL